MSLKNFNIDILDGGDLNHEGWDPGRTHDGVDTDLDHDGRDPHHLPVAVIGAGPIGLAAAAHLLDAGLEPAVFEAGDAVGVSVREWGHVRVFSPWEIDIDPVAGRLLAEAGWDAPPATEQPTGAEIVERYLEPLAALPAIAASLHLGSRVVAVTKHGIDKLKDGGRDEAPFELIVEQDGAERRFLAAAVIDASGTWTQPNPLGSGGLPAAGERTHADRIAYGIPDVLGEQRERYAGKRVLVAGSGHSAFNAILDLVALREHAPATEVVWAIRGTNAAAKLDGFAAEELPARGALGKAVGRLVRDGVVQLVGDFQTEGIEHTGDHTPVGESQSGALRRDPRLLVTSGDRALVVDEIIATTGFRPDLSVLRELRLDLDDRVEAPRALAPLIDPNIHDCGSVPLHGADELGHPEAGVYVVGMKSYGRAPTFLLRTGYEQVRSVVAALAGDIEPTGHVTMSR
jgi:cation diffusion facilitator CzcD-associated flavoprotein CzcO